MTTTQNQLNSVLTDLADLLEQIPSGAAGPTPCTDYDQATLRQHVIGWLTAFTEGFEDPEGNCGDPESVVVDGNGATQVRGLRDRLDAALSDGAGERPLSIGGAAMPGAMALEMILWEYQMHGWDLARSAGLDWSPEVNGLEASLAFAPAMLTPDFQGVGKSFAPQVAVPADAPALDRLAGLSGRDPRWSHA
ncbi:TIGR03086 family metal-binding protein [Tessaracoccus flavescens]|uniref:TIGR03086 family protein n=1 Tax=Tessaracoccus flavescens TaxID=399497 RepID=A0A1Q2CYS7_9ACTN|nr:TIGR03086 family metal-binding protein [Tessaracoccus flavescens]AQP51267.1 TIGR03086 family protein [Tessaracoccus flavescens]